MLKERQMISRRNTLLTFVIGGPLLWLPILMVWALIVGHDFHGEHWSALLLTPAMGGFFWCLAAIFPRGWLFTWIPTLGAALLYREVVNRLERARDLRSSTRLGSMVLHFVIAAAISALVFSSCVAIAGLLGLQVPFIPNALPIPHHASGAMDQPLSKEMIVGVVTMVGGILGGVIGVLSPTVAAPAEDAPKLVSSRGSFPSPSLRLVVCTFLVVGPLFYMPLLAILSPAMPSAMKPLASSFRFVLSAPIGAMVWYGTVLFPPTWLQTWMPTVATAFLFRSALARLPVREWALRHHGESGVIIAYATICGALSVIVFALCQLLDGIFQHNAAQPAHRPFDDLVGSATGHTVVIAIAILGVIIGAAVYVLERRMSPRNTLKP
jgi:hypothetical protein